MEALLYLGKAGLYLWLFYGCYTLLFRRQTFFHLNRAYLLAGLLLSLLLPLITLQAPVQEVIPLAEVTVDFPVSTLPVVVQADAARPLPWVEILLAVYIAGVVWSLAGTARKLWRLRTFLKSQEEVISNDGVSVIVLDHDKAGSFSFMNWVVIGRLDYELHFDTILRHEMTHVRQGHSWDILAAELCGAIFWFLYPIPVWYKNALQEIHEFLADSTAPDREGYAAFLVAYTLEDRRLSGIVNHFFNTSMLVRRVRMLYKARNSRSGLCLYLLIVPLAMFTVSLTAAREHVYPVTVVADHKAEEAQRAAPSLPGALEDVSARQLTEKETVDISGNIKDKDGHPLAGAAVVVKSEILGTVSDSNGSFRLEGVPVGTELMVSHVGYIGQTLRIAGPSKGVVYNVTLERASQALEELVVVGYLGGAGSKPVEQSTEYLQPSGGAFTVVEQMPEFPGGTKALYTFLARHIRYPAEAMRAGVSGKVEVQFIVNSTGNIREPKVVKGLGYGIDEEAIRQVLNMPRWKPARQFGKAVDVSYTLPITFSLENAGETEDKGSRQGNNTEEEKPVPNFRAPGDELRTEPARFSIRGSQGPFEPDREPLYLLDGKEINRHSLEGLAPDSIAEITVLKNTGSTSMYGDKGRNGVVIITTKK